MPRRRRRSFSYSRPVNTSASSSRSSSRTSTIHRLPLRGSPRRTRKASRSPSYARRRRKKGRPSSRSRSPPQWRPMSPMVRQADCYSPPRRNYANRSSPQLSSRRRFSRSFSRESVRRSRSCARKPLQKGPRDSVEEFASSRRGNKPRSRRDASPPRHYSMLSPLKGWSSGSLEPGGISASEFIHTIRPTIQVPPKAIKFASSIKLSDAIMSSFVSPPQPAQLPEQTEACLREGREAAAVSGLDTATRPAGGLASDACQSGPSDSDMESDGYLRTTKYPVIPKPVNAEVAPLADNLDGDIRQRGDSTIPIPSHTSLREMCYSSTAANCDLRLACTSPEVMRARSATPATLTPRGVQERLQELAQALSAIVESKIDSESQGLLPSADKSTSPNKSKEELKREFQEFGSSTMRRCHRMIAEMVNDVLLQVGVRSGVKFEPTEGMKQACGRCDQLEQRIHALEQQKLDEASIMAHIENNTEKKLEKMFEAHATKASRKINPDVVASLRKRRRGDNSPISTSLLFAEDDSEGMITTRLSKLESMVSLWEKPSDALAVEGSPTVETDGKFNSVIERVKTLEDDSAQVFGHLSIHQSAIKSLGSALSLDPAKPLGQVIDRLFNNLRTEMAHMLTDAFGALEDSLARAIVGVIIKQTKLELQANSDTLAREVIRKVISQMQTSAKGKEPVTSPALESASVSTSEDFQAIGPEIALSAIKAFPSMKQ